jgi:hypothetical protein
VKDWIERESLLFRSILSVNGGVAGVAAGVADAGRGMTYMGGSP